MIWFEFLAWMDSTMGHWNQWPETSHHSKRPAVPIKMNSMAMTEDLYKFILERENELPVNTTRASPCLTLCSHLLECIDRTSKTLPSAVNSTTFLVKKSWDHTVITHQIVTASAITSKIDQTNQLYRSFLASIFCTTEKELSMHV